MYGLFRFELREQIYQARVSDKSVDEIIRQQNVIHDYMT